jgi:hypothetical protein
VAWRKGGVDTRGGYVAVMCISACRAIINQGNAGGEGDWGVAEWGTSLGLVRWAVGWDGVSMIAVLEPDRCYLMGRAAYHKE